MDIWEKGCGVCAGLGNLMRLSEAMRRWTGAQAHGRFVSQTGMARCALGAALWATGAPSRRREVFDQAGEQIEPHVLLLSAWPCLLSLVASPVDDQAIETIFKIITRLNDDRHWTIPQIADWVASVEGEEAR